MTSRCPDGPPTDSTGRIQAMAAPEIDFEAEGLLEGVEGAPREARRGLPEQLVGEGCTLEELKEAVAAGRLTLLPVERALAGAGPRYTAREIAEMAELDLDVLQRFSSAISEIGRAHV